MSFDIITLEVFSKLTTLLSRPLQSILRNPSAGSNSPSSNPALSPPMSRPRSLDNAPNAQGRASLFIDLEGAETGESEDHAVSVRRGGLGVGSSPRRVRTGRDERNESGLVERHGDGESGVNSGEDPHTNSTPGNDLRSIDEFLIVQLDLL